MDTQNRLGRMIPGTAVGNEKYLAFVPPPLPPEPPINMIGLQKLLEKATAALGRLDGISSILPDSALFLYMYVRKEAVLSSQIEGTQSSLSDLLLFETAAAPGAPLDDVTEVSCYVKAMNYGLDRLDTLPLSLRLIREIHRELMANARGGTKQPGEFRQSQNWIGGTRPGNAMFVPPPPEHLETCLAAFETFLHDDGDAYPTLIKAALAHVQFETIHPFLDGNGRLGRLLIALILCSEGMLQTPVLYLSLYFKTHRQAYYDHLQNVRETGDWESWIAFFLAGVAETATQANETAHAIIALFKRDVEKLQNVKKSRANVQLVHNYLQQNPLVKISAITNDCGISDQTARRLLTILTEEGIVQEVTGRERHRIYAYTEYLAILNDGTHID